MSEIIYKFADLEVSREEGRYFVLYDAGAHMVRMRKDEISEEEAVLTCEGKEGTMATLFGLQKRLIAAGIDPYASNVDV